MLPSLIFYVEDLISIIVYLLLLSCFNLFVFQSSLKSTEMKTEMENIDWILKF